MISQITGKISYIEPGLVVVDANGVGYAVNISKDAATSAKVGDTISFWTHLAVRETSMELFGFANREELSLFEMLNDVPGIGPRSALAILSMATTDTLKKAIAEENVTYLTKVSGIGKKTAEKIVVTLKDKLGKSGDTTGALSEDADVLEVLVSLGYSQSEARKAVQKIDENISGASERTKEALKILGARH